MEENKKVLRLNWKENTNKKSSNDGCPRICLEILKERGIGYWRLDGTVSSGQKFLLYKTGKRPNCGIIGYGEIVKDGEFLSSSIAEDFKLNLLSGWEKRKFAQIKIFHLNLDGFLADVKIIEQYFDKLTNFATVGSKSINSEYQTQARKLFSFLEKKNLSEQLENLERKLDFSKVDTETKNLVVQRVGQRLLRKELLELHHGMCQVSGEARQDLLVCSHIVPWKDDKDNRLNPDNALLLAFNYDFLFDKGYITFENDGKIKIAEMVDNHFGISEHDRLREKELTEEMKKFLEYHRTHIFKK